MKCPLCGQEAITDDQEFDSIYNDADISEEMVHLFDEIYADSKRVMKKAEGIRLAQIDLYRGKHWGKQDDHPTH